MLNSKILASAELSGQRFELNLSSRFAGAKGGGKYGSKTGQSLEFVEHRDYQPGDDIRHLDWNVVARSDKLAIKLFREEITPYVDFLLDLSTSMAINQEKFNALAAITLILIKASYNSGYTNNAWLIKDLCRKVEPANLPIDKWTDFEANANNNTGKTIFDFPPKLKNGAVRFLISDLFWNQEPMGVLRKLSDGAAALIVIQLVSNQDINPDIYGNMRLIDSESGEALELICDEALIEDYKKNFDRHSQYWKECCTKSGAAFCFIEAEKLLKDFIPEELIKNEILVLGHCYAYIYKLLSYLGKFNISWTNSSLYLQKAFKKYCSIFLNVFL